MPFCFWYADSCQAREFFRVPIRALNCRKLPMQGREAWLVTRSRRPQNPEAPKNRGGSGKEAGVDRPIGTGLIAENGTGLTAEPRRRGCRRQRKAEEKKRWKARAEATGN